MRAQVGQGEHNRRLAIYALKCLPETDMPPYDLIRSILSRAHVHNPDTVDAGEVFREATSPGPVPHAPDVYDPVLAAYEDASPAYEPPPPWFERLPITGTPSPPRVPNVAEQVEPDQVRYDHTPMD